MIRAPAMRTRSSKRRSKRGVALVLALGVLSVMLICAFSAASLRHHQRSMAILRLHRELARQEALYGLQSALAALEDTVGHDRCASAPGSIRPLSAQPYWTLAQRPNEPAVFLVTGTPEDSHVTADCLLIGPNTVSDEVNAQVSVPTAETRDNEGQLIGRYAWWVGDQGIKAALVGADGRNDPLLFPGDTPGDGPSDPWQRLRQNIPGPAKAPATLSDQILSTGRSGSPALVASTGTTRAIRAAFHDFCSWNCFTITNSLNGGTKEDLSPLANGTAGVAAYRHTPPPSVADWLQLRVPIEGDLPIGPATEPVLTEFALIGGIAADTDQWNVYRRTLPVKFCWLLWVDLWNPYTRRLPYGKADADIRVVVHGLPQLRLSSGSAQLPDPFVINLDSYAALPAGRVVLLSSPEQDQGDFHSGTWHQDIGSIFMPRITMPVHAEFAAANVTVEFYDLASSDSEPFHTVQLSGYEPFSIDYGSTQPFGRSASVEGIKGMNRDALSYGNWAFAYHFRMRDAFDSNRDELTDWLTERDPREQDVALDVKTGGDTNYAVLPRPQSYDREDVIRADDFWASRYDGPYIDRKALLFDPPADAPTSLLSLRHAPNNDLPPLAIGRGISAEADAWLDRYFLSTIPPGWGGKTPLAQYRIETVGRSSITPSPNDAEQLLLRNGFNINSTSPAAWEAVLRSLSQSEWQMGRGQRMTTKPLALPVFNLPWTGAAPGSDAAYDAMVSGDTSALDAISSPLAVDRTHPAFITGVRDIGEDNVAALARNICANIRKHGRPFQSLSEFAQSHVLQDAIDSIPALNRRSHGRDCIPEGSPAHIDQGALLCALAPVLAARSDTFLVRTHGQHVNKGGKVDARVWLEACVQRSPAPLPESADERPFHIVYVRWLNATEL